jgi:multidrug resistance efflux pump
MPPGNSIRGIGEGKVSIITSPINGYLRTVDIQQRGWVKAGGKLVTIVPFDPKTRMDMFQSELQLSRLGIEPTIGDRNALNYEQLRVESMRLKREQAMAKANLDRVQKTLPRHEALAREKLLSQDAYDLTVRDRDYYQAQVDELNKAIIAVDDRLKELQSLSQISTANSTNVAASLLPQFREQMKLMETNLNPITLTAPFEGEAQFYRSEGEFVAAGTPILVLNSPRADRVVAYLKQPAGFDPEVGMRMQARTRSHRPVVFDTEIAMVGARVEVITNALAFVATGALVDTGLPLVLPIPDNVQIRPGEALDVFWKGAKQGGGTR